MIVRRRTASWMRCPDAGVQFTRPGPDARSAASRTSMSTARASSGRSQAFGRCLASLVRAVPKVCYVCRKGPAFGHSRSHSMVATKRRFNPNLQKVRIDVGGRPGASTSARAASRPARSPRPPDAARSRYGVKRTRARREPRPLPAASWPRARRAREPPPGGQRPQRVPGRRRRHGRQHGDDACAPCSTSSTA